MYEDHPVEVFAAGAQPHPNQNRIAVVTAAFGDGIQLYIADGAETVNDVPESIYRITDDANGEFSSHAGKKVTVLNMYKISYGIS